MGYGTVRKNINLVIGVIIFSFGGILNLFLSTMLHELLTNGNNDLAFPSISHCLKSIISERQHLLLFLCIQGFFLILAVLFFTANLHPYQSELDEITPDIRTPRAVGQYQHGSARWMTDAEKEKAFSSFILNPHDEAMKALLDSGYEDIDFIEHGKEEADEHTPSNSKDGSC